MKKGTVTKGTGINEGFYEVLIGVVDLGFLGIAPNVTSEDNNGKKFESEAEAKKWWEENKQLFK